MENLFPSEIGWPEKRDPVASVFSKIMGWELAVCVEKGRFGRPELHFCRLDLREPPEIECRRGHQKLPGDLGQPPQLRLPHATSLFHPSEGLFD